MEKGDTSDEADGVDPISLKVDEVAEAADITTTAATADTSKIEEIDAAVPARLARAMEEREQNTAPSTARLPTRPQLLRGGSAPPPPQQPPPPAPLQQQPDEVGNTTDSLSLLQLKRLVNDLPKTEPTAYAFEYQDTQSFPEELEEWFQYTEEDKGMVLRGRATFETKWEAFLTQGAPAEETPTWTQASDDQRKSFVMEQISGLADVRLSTRVSCLESITYVALGAWAETAGLREESGSDDEAEEDAHEADTPYDLSSLQIRWMRKGAEIILGCSGIEPIFDAFRRICDQEQLVRSQFPQPSQFKDHADNVDSTAIATSLTNTREWERTRRRSSKALDRRRSTTPSP